VFDVPCDEGEQVFDTLSAKKNACFAGMTGDDRRIMGIFITTSTLSHQGCKATLNEQPIYSVLV